MSAHQDFIRSSFKKDITKEQSKDSGLAILLILILLGYFTGNSFYFTLTLPVLLVIMITPGWFKPFGIIWFTFSYLIGSVMSKILLSIIFFIVVLPVAFIRKVFGIDNLKLTQFKKGNKSVMYIRDHRFLRSDIEKPY
jgi:hypothetical protein